MTYYGHRRDDLSALPEETIKELKKNIKDGAKDTDQKWTNALELVHKAYQVAEVQRPDVTMRDAWKQYESLIRFAVNQLADTRGIDGEWRMTDQLTVEDVDYIYNFKVKGKTFDGETYEDEVSSNDIANIVGQIVENSPCECDVYVDNNDAVIHFKENGTRTGDKVYVYRNANITEGKWRPEKYKQRLDSHAKRAGGTVEHLRRVAEYMYDGAGWKYISGKKSKEEFIQDYIDAVKRHGNLKE